MSEFDVYLNGVGFMLPKDSNGKLVSGAVREVLTDTFTRTLATEEPYTRVPFRFGDGAGLSEYDGSSRYEWGNQVDARSGRLLMATERVETTTPPAGSRSVKDNSVLSAEGLNNQGSQWAIAQKFTIPGSYVGVRSVAVLVRRDTLGSYASASDWVVAFHADDNGKPAGAATEYKELSLINEEDWSMPFPDRWRNGDWFWIEAVMDDNAVFDPGADYWISIGNTANDTETLYAAEDQSLSQTALRSVHNGTAWGTATYDYPLMIKVGYKDSNLQFDAFIRCLTSFRGSGGVERMYAGTSYRVLACDPTYYGGFWTEDKTIGGPVTALVNFTGKMFAACGPNIDFYWCSGANGGAGDWTQITGEQATALAVHDKMLWKADLASLKGSTDGTTWTGAACTVGDTGTAVQAMVSHGGKLFCAKPEGIYEVTYPDDYPGTTAPTANLMLDFSTERCPRTWILDWHSGLYFPGLAGIYELKGGVLRNLWEDKVDENAIDNPDAGRTALGIGGNLSRRFTRPRSWAPLYDHGPVGWYAANASTRGILFARSNPHIHTSDLIWYDGKNWFSIRAAGNDVDGAPGEFGEYVTACFLQDAGGGRGWLWWSEGFRICRCEWPTWTDDTADALNKLYEGNGQATTPWFSLSERSRKMLLYKVGVTGVNLNSDRTAQIWYRLSRGASWTLLGTTIQSYAALSFSSPVSTRAVQFKIVLTNGATTRLMSPAVEQIDLFYQLVPELTRTHQLLIDCSPSQSLREGGVDERSTYEIVFALKMLFTGGTWTYIDPLGTSHTVRPIAMTHQPMSQTTGPGATERGITSQVVLSLLEI